MLSVEHNTEGQAACGIIKLLSPLFTDSFKLVKWECFISISFQNDSTPEEPAYSLDK